MLKVNITQFSWMASFSKSQGSNITDNKIGPEGHEMCRGPLHQRGSHTYVGVRTSTTRSEGAHAIYRPEKNCR